MVFNGEAKRIAMVGSLGSINHSDDDEVVTSEDEDPPEGEGPWFNAVGD
jgi:hypothetical protein